MTVKWQPENAEGSLWSATVTDGQQGWFDIQMERGPDGWDWVINHDRRFWGQEDTFEQANTAVATQLEQMGQHFPRCEIRPFTENEGGGYLISSPDFPGVVASGAMPENAIQRGRDALDVYRSTIRRAEILNAAI
jgi:predicted RNase H-like HicB family nuclease